MKKNLLLSSLFLFVASGAFAGKLIGTITGENGSILPFASVFVKGTTKGTTSNNQGKYSLELDAGEYTIVCQYVGYQRQEKKITVSGKETTLDFQLSLQQLSLKEVVVRPGGEDPAYEIIRQAIKKRSSYEAPLDSFTCEAYIKTLIKTRKIPKKVFGQKIEDQDRKEMGVDSAGKGIIYLSESLTKIAFKKPNRTKLEVLSGREAGGNGFGFNFPTFINFYSNNVTVLSTGLNPRGFVSPVAESALNYYRYKFLGSFFEDGKEVNKIQVTPRRKFEPLFEGTINITEGDWRIHSLDLTLFRHAQLEILDTLEIRQIHVPVTQNIWQTKDQVVRFTFNIFGIDAVGNFLNVYNKYDVDPQFGKKYFNNVIVRYDTAVNKKTVAYWDSVRPVQLEPEELKDYHVKDSIYKSNRDSLGSRQNIDSMKKRQGHITAAQILTKRINRSNFSRTHPFNYSFRSLLNSVQYNTVEGINAELTGSMTWNRRTLKHQLQISPHIRYGFGNTHLNPWVEINWSKRSFEFNEYGSSSGRNSWMLSGGKRVRQFNPENPITEINNTEYTLLAHENYMKIYENYFADLSFQRRFDNGLRLTAGTVYEDRLPVENTSNYSLFKKTGKDFTPNYPYEKIDTQFTRHQALITGINIQFQPGQRFIEFPNFKMPVGSKYPTLAFEYRHGWKNVFGSDVDFDKWKFSVWDQVNFKLKGTLKYRFDLGGFLNSRSVYIQDYQHFNGNQLIFASEYMNSFQIAPYYANSTTAAFYAIGHLEHHFNGLLTNKIPLFRNLKWNLVAASNAFYVNRNNNYFEVSAGLENILKIFRVDIVESFLNGHYGTTGVRIGFGGIIGGNIRRNGDNVQLSL